MCCLFVDNLTDYKRTLQEQFALAATEAARQSLTVRFIRFNCTDSEDICRSLGATKPFPKVIVTSVTAASGNRHKLMYKQYNAKTLVDPEIFANALAEIVRMHEQGKPVWDNDDTAADRSKAERGL